MQIPTIPDKLKAKVAKKVAAYVKLVEEDLHFPFPPIEITYNACGRAAGLAYFDLEDGFRINLNPYLMLSDTETMLKKIVGHEVAHLASMNHYGSDIAPHGEEWKQFMRLFKIKPEAFHSMDVSVVASRVARWKHRCDCPGKVHEMSSLSNRYIRTKQTPRICCMKCGTHLRPMERHNPIKGLPKELQHETKMNKAKWVMKKHHGKPRSKVIPLLQELAGLSAAGASTYYHNILESSR